MRAVRFVKNQINELGFDAGWIMAKAHLDYLISYGSEFGHVSRKDVEELKQLVDSWKLVDELGGLKKCIEDHSKYKFDEQTHKYYLECSIDRLKQAIRDVESIGGGV